MCTLLAGLRACTSNSRGALATCSRTNSGSSFTTSPSTCWPALANSSTASGLANWMPISETIRRQPRSSTAIESAERISYLGIVLTNIELHRAFESAFESAFKSAFKPMGRNLTDLKPRPYDHIVELGPIKWNTAIMTNQNGTQAVDRAAQLLSE